MPPLHQLFNMQLSLQGEACGVWQHCRCVGLDPDATPEHYFCQRCRIALADPFWQADSIPLFTPAKLELVPARPFVRPAGKEETKLADRAFRLSPAQLEPLRRNSQTEQLHVRLSSKSCLKVCGSFCSADVSCTPLSASLLVYRSRSAVLHVLDSSFVCIVR